MIVPTSHNQDQVPARHSGALNGSINSAYGEPIAIIGLGCRFPGDADDWQSYWELLDSGRDAISDTPESRWNLQKFYAPETARPGKTQSKWGGYVNNIDKFDPQLFGISPREAASMDPQQRMLLEVAFRAVEDAGYPAERLSGQPVSVFVGISSFDYAVASLSFQDRGVINAYSNTGGSSSIAANRISYCFDLRGPSVAVDTACSSSLVAVHMACESIWRGEVSMALAGGVNALLMPDFYVAFSQLGVLSPDGRCKTFDARANGYVRSEGAGMAMLKPLRDALRDKDPIYAVVRATALNQDGRTPGMTVPSQTAQETLLRTACQKAGIHPSQIQYVEAHGTGTPVGDPIEARALGAVLGEGRAADQPCRIGSVKTNIGHLEAGAGIASFLKVALALHHQRIPQHLHFENANPEIDFAGLGLQVPVESVAWPGGHERRLAGINGFGYGGANAHVILEEAPMMSGGRVAPNLTRFTSEARGESNQRPQVLAAPVLLPLSARSKPALAELATELTGWLETHSDYDLAEVAGFLAHRRSHHNFRATACATTHATMVDELRALADASPDEFADEFPASKIAKGAVFVCSGQGPQWWAMGRGLLKYSPAFRSVIKRCDTEFSKLGDWSLVEELTRSESTSRMQQTSIAQPCIFAIQVALAAVWESWGIKPAAVVGHSVGEIAAAYLSGALDWEDACCVAFHRGRTMDLASSKGAMVAAGLSAEEVPEWLHGMEEDVSLAAINGPSSVTISGEMDAIESLALRLESEGIFCRRLAVEYAFHSPQMKPVRDELQRSLEHIRPRRSHTPIVSTVTGTAVEGSELGAEYWWQNVRQSVRFSDAMRVLADRGFGVAIEIGPHPVLAYAMNECFQSSGASVRSVPSLNRQQDDLQCITKSLGSLYGLGFDINWKGFYNQPTRKLPLPTYPFQLQRLWSESQESRTTRLSDTSHPLLGNAVDGASDRWHSRIDLRSHQYLAGHTVRGGCMYPAAAMIETALATASAIHEIDRVRLERVRLHSPLTITAEHAQWIETSVDRSKGQIDLAFRDCDDSEWAALATINMSGQSPTPPTQLETSHAERIQAVRERCTEGFDQRRLYDYCDQLGLNYGPAFQGITNGLRVDGEALAEVVMPETVVDDYQLDQYRFHPALLDSCFHAMIAADPNFDHMVDGLFLPVAIAEVGFYRSPSRYLTVHARVIHKSSTKLVCDVDIFDSEGLCATLRKFESQRVSGGASAETVRDLVYSYAWIEQPIPKVQPQDAVTNTSSDDTTVPCESGDSGSCNSPSCRPTETSLDGAGSCETNSWVVFMDEGGTGRELACRLRRRGDQVIEIYREQSSVPQATESPFFQVDPESRDSMHAAITSALRQVDFKLDRIVYLWGLDAPNTEAIQPVLLDQSTQLTTLAPLHLVQVWEELESAPAVRLAVVSAGAQSHDSRPEPLSVAQGPLIGFGRVIVSEFAKFDSKLIDLPHSIGPNDLDYLVSELLTDDHEDEILWRNGKRFVHRFSPQPDQAVSKDVAAAMGCRLRVGDSCGIEELHYVTQPQRPLQPGEVEIEVVASGLNFSDVMKALDLYPGLPDGPVDLGAECSGRISRTAPNSGWNVGDEVIAVAPGSFATHVIVGEALVARKPSNLSHEQAAAIPIAFLTAEYALHDCARIQPGDSVLIHSASGGVGLAAMQLANLSEAKIFATAGTDEKRQFVRQRGAVHVMDSRSLHFADETLQATGGAGVDAILNSLPGEAIRKGLSILKTGGRFLEIGKRDIYDDSALGLYPFRNNLAMFAIDLDQLFKQQPARMGQMLNAIVDRFEAGELQPLPITSFDASETAAAFRFMQQGKHIGKVVVDYDRAPEHVSTGDYETITFETDATYWLAGGLGGFGLEIARWMSRQGARHLVLSGRSNRVRPEASRVIAELASQGTQVTVLPADITQAEEVRRVLATIEADLPPLRGIFHTAMVLEDKLLVDLDRDTLERVLRPKVLGGWNLHQESLEIDLDYFVLFSSLSSVFGHAGQANYSAANALLDSLAHYRRSQNLPATVMNWGHLGEVGYLAEREQLGQRLERQGVLSFSVKQATDCLEYALQTQAIQLSVLRMDWTLWRGLGITSRVSPRFADLLQSVNDPSANGSLASASNLRAASAADRERLVDELLRNKTGMLLGIPASQIQSQRALLEMGLDSLMAVEMRNWIESQLEISLPISALMRSESLAQVVELICQEIDGNGGVLQNEPETFDAPSTTHEISAQDAEDLLEQLPNLAADDVSQLLGQMLREQE